MLISPCMYSLLIHTVATLVLGNTITTKYWYCRYQVLGWWYRVLELGSFDTGCCYMVMWPEVSAFPHHLSHLNACFPNLENSLSKRRSCLKLANVNMLLLQKFVMLRVWISKGVERYWYRYPPQLYPISSAFCQAYPSHCHPNNISWLCNKLAAHTFLWKGTTT